MSIKHKSTEPEAFLRATSFRMVSILLIIFKISSCVPICTALTKLDEAGGGGGYEMIVFKIFRKSHDLSRVFRRFYE